MQMLKTKKKKKKKDFQAKPVSNVRKINKMTDNFK